MNQIDLNNLIEYTLCPHRLSFAKGSDQIFDIQSLKIYLFSNLIKYGIFLKASGYAPSVPRLNKKLNLLWSKLPSVVANIADKLSISKRLVEISTLIESLGEIIVYNYDVSYRVYDTVINATVSSFSIIDNEGIVFVPYTYKSMGLHNKSSVPVLLANTMYYAINSLFYRHIKTTKIIVYRVETGELSSVSPLDKDLVIANLSGIIRAIDSSAFYPRSDIITCTYCPYSDQCTWSLK